MEGINRELAPGESVQLKLFLLSNTTVTPELNLFLKQLGTRALSVKLGEFNDKLVVVVHYIES